MTPKELAESIERIRSMPNDRLDMMQTINALVELIISMRELCKGQDVGNGLKVYYGDKIEAAMALSAPIATLSEKQ